jgi:hypothetical protein
MHQYMVLGAELGYFRYAIRHAFPGQTPVSASRTLQGYGVFLDIKNMEYKNVDDSGSKNSGSDTDDFQVGEEIKVSASLMKYI